MIGKYLKLYTIPLSILLILLTLILHINRYKNINFSSWLGFLDTDILYQSERLLMNYNPNYLPLIAGNLDYGSELLYLSIFNHLFDNQLIGAFWIITITHILAFGLALFVLIFSFDNIPLIVKTSTLLISLSLPLIVMHSTFIKPDMNVVFLFTLLAIWSISRFISTPKMVHIIFALLFAGAATAIKWWGIMLLPSCIYILQNEISRDKNHLITQKMIQYILFAVHAVIPFVIYHLVNNIFHALEGDIAKIKFYVPFLSVESFTHGNMLKVILFCIFATAVSCYLMYLAIGKVTRPIVLNTIFCLTLFSLVYMVINLPFMISSQFHSSVYFFKQFIEINPSENQYLFFRRVIYAYEMGFFSWISLPLLGLVVFRQIKRRSSAMETVLLIYIATFLFFLYFAVNKVGGTQEALIMPFVWLLGLIAFYEQMRKFRYKNYLIMLIVLFEIAYQNSLIPSPVQLPNIVRYFQSYDGLGHNIRSFQMKVKDTVGDNKIFSCDSTVPLEEYNKRLHYKECSDQIYVEYLMQNDDVLVINSHYLNKFKWINNSANFFLVEKIGLEHPGRDGTISEVKMLIYKKI
jgi:hypothetical protein